MLKCLEKSTRWSGIFSLLFIGTLESDSSLSTLVDTCIDGEMIPPVNLVKTPVTKLLEECCSVRVQLVPGWQVSYVIL